MSLPKEVFVDHYKALGLSQTATLAEVKKAFHQYALKYHPDRKSSEAEKKKATPIFQAVSAANAVLSDPAARREYDLEYAEHISGEGKAKNGHPARSFPRPTPPFKPPQRSSSTSKGDGDGASPEPSSSKPRVTTTPDFVISGLLNYKFSDHTPYVDMNGVPIGSLSINTPPLISPRFKNLNRMREAKGKAEEMSKRNSVNMGPLHASTDKPNSYSHFTFKLSRPRSQPQPSPSSPAQDAYAEARAHYKGAKRAYATARDEVTLALLTLFTEDDVSNAMYKIERCEGAFDGYLLAAKRYTEVIRKNREVLGLWLGEYAVSEDKVRGLVGSMEVERDEVREAVSRWKGEVEDGAKKIMGNRESKGRRMEA
jgi:curved DNA-binding protein CbpA